MFGWTSKWLSVFVTPFGVALLAFLDSTLFFSVPFGIDIVVVVLAARMRDLFWLVPVLATAGASGGAWLTFWMGEQAGEHGLERYVSRRRLEKIRSRIRRSGAVALAALDLVPPPFPFTPFVVAAGAFKVSRSRFFVTLMACRLLRFGAEATLALFFGRRILAWLESDIVRRIVGLLIVLAVAMTVVSIGRLAHSARRPQRPAPTTS